jgi:multiple sugar transport system ATP-binding protein
LEAVSLGDKIAVIREGRIEQVGTYNELLLKPVNVFVADFIGNPLMNLFPPALVQEGMLSITDNLSIPLPKNLKRRVKNGHTVILGVRPEAISLTKDIADSSDIVTIPGIVDVIEQDVTRQKQTVHVRTGKISYRALIPLDLQYKPDEQVRALFSFSDCFFFDGLNRVRIEI